MSSFFRLIIAGLTHPTDGSERQNIKDLDGSTPRAKIKSCSIADPYVVVVREDNTLGLFIGETGKGKMRRKDMSMLGDKVDNCPARRARRLALPILIELTLTWCQMSRYLAASFYQDQSGIFKIVTRASGVQGPASTTIENAMDEGRGTQWLVLVRPQGVVEVGVSFPNTIMPN